MPSTPDRRHVRAALVGVALTMFIGLSTVEYTVQRGDTLGRIAKEQGVTLSDLIAANEIANPNLIYPGQVLRIPGEDGGPEAVHVVSRGDTLAAIASQYDTTISALIKANGIDNPHLILPGQQIVIPASGSSGVTASGRRSHLVAKGESLESIAAQYGITVDQLARANGILDKSVFTGSRLFLEGPEFIATGVGATEISYVVQSGDRLGDIAHAHGVSVTAIIERNGIADPDLIKPGQTLAITGGVRWVCPVTDARFFNDWGFPRAGSRYHEGNDLFAPHGSPVYAPVPGRVEQVTGTIGGKQINLDGDDGVRYLGSHLSEFGKSGRVNAGDIVGYVGSSGNAEGTNPHLHFGMYLPGGIPINPYPTLIANGCK